MLYKKELREKERHRCEKKGKENRKKERGKYSIVTIIQQRTVDSASENKFLEKTENLTTFGKYLISICHQYVLCEFRI